MSRPVFASVLAVLSSALALAGGALGEGTPPEIDVVLPRSAGSSRPAEFLYGMASSGLLPGASVREARRGEAPRIYARFRLRDLPLVPEATRVLDAAGLREVTLQIFPDGDIIRAVASVRIDGGAPAPPVANAPLSPPAMRDGDWAAAAVHLDTKRLVPWALGVASRTDEFQGQMLADALVVARWNIGLDVEHDLAGSFEGGVRALASRGSADSAAVVADVRTADPLAKALAALAVASRLVRVAGVGIEPARFGNTQGYRVRTPWPTLAPAVVLRDGALVASAGPGTIAAGPGALLRRLAPSPVDERPRSLAEVGGGDWCAAGVVNVLECVRAAREVARAVGLDASTIPAPASLAWADGEAAVAVRVGGEGFQVWGAWAPSRSALAVPPDDTVAGR